MRNEEHKSQSALVKWALYAQATTQGLDLLHAIPNGGHRIKAIASMMKAEGVKAGVPDFCLPVSRGGYNALYIEMKAPQGKLSRHQKHWMKRLIEEGNYHRVCRSSGEAIDAISEYLGGGKQK